MAFLITCIETCSRGRYFLFEKHKDHHLFTCELTPCALSSHINKGWKSWLCVYFLLDLCIVFVLQSNELAGRMHRSFTSAYMQLCLRPVFRWCLVAHIALQARLHA